jgi:hypothetical protein
LGELVLDPAAAMGRRSHCQTLGGEHCFFEATSRGFQRKECHEFRFPRS